MALVNALTWLAWGRTELAERGLKVVWTESAVPSYQERYDALVVFAATPPQPERLQRPDGVTMPVQALDAEQLYATFEQLDTPMVAAYSAPKWWNPFVVRTTTGYWLVGSDHVEQYDEWLLWAFASWVPVWKSGRFQQNTF